MDPYGYDDGADDQQAQALAALAGIPLQQAKIEAKRRRGQAMFATPTPGGREVGRTYVASSPLEHLAAAMTRTMGLRDMKAADADMAPLIQQQQAGAAAQARQQLADKRFGQSIQLGGLRRQQAADAAAREHQAATLTLQQQEAARKAKADEAEAAYRAGTLGIQRQGLSQDAWMAVPDASGGIVMFNKKTGEHRALGPQGGMLPGRTAPYPGKPVQMEDDVQKLGKDVEPLAKARSDIDALRDAAEKGDVAGFGPVAGRVPNMLTSGEGVANRQAAGRLMAAIIQATSGQAASEKEVDRLLEANGMGRTATDEQLRIGIAKLDAQYQNLLKQREAKYHPSVVDTYGQRGGFTSTTAGPGTSPNASGPVRVSTKAERDALPPGTQYVGPDGKTYTKR